VLTNYHAQELFNIVQEAGQLATDVLTGLAHGRQLQGDHRGHQRHRQQAAGRRSTAIEHGEDTTDYMRVCAYFGAKARERWLRLDVVKN
jgi:hypothetical protein